MPPAWNPLRCMSFRSRRPSEWNTESRPGGDGHDAVIAMGADAAGIRAVR